MNNRSNILNQRLPAFFGLFFLVFSIGALVWFSSNVVFQRTQAAAGSEPRNVQISNISESEFTVSYTTDDLVVGSLNYGTTPQLGQVALDERDVQTSKPNPHRVHYITVKGLSPSTKYNFSVVSGIQTYTNNNAPYDVTTAPSVGNFPAAQPTVKGSVTLEDGSIPAEGIALLTTDDSQLISTLLKPDGGYALDLTNIRKKNLADHLSINPDTVLHLTVLSPTLQSTLSVIASQANPVPLIILAKNYDFTLSSDPLSPSPEASVSGEPASFPTVSDDTSGPASPQILTPKSDQQFKDLQPEFSGKALPNATVEVTINSDTEITAQVQADSNGTWEYRPNAPLPPGNHTLTIKTPDASGILQTITQSFVVYAQGSEFTEPSVSPKVSPTATSVPTPTAVSIVPTASPSATTAPTLTTSPTTTVQPSPSGPTANVTKPPVPNSGSSTLLTSIFVTGGIVVGGIILFFLTMGGSL